MHICKYMKLTMVVENGIRTGRYICPYKTTMKINNNIFEFNGKFNSAITIPPVICPKDVKYENGKPICFITD